LAAVEDAAVEAEMALVEAVAKEREAMAMAVGVATA